MNQIEIIDFDGRKILVSGIYYISNNNYYFIYTQKENDDEGHIILYITKILQEVSNTDNGPQPTGYLIGVKITDEQEYALVKQDIIKIVAAKQSNQENPVRMLELNMLSNLKINSNRIFKLDKAVFNEVFESGEKQPVVQPQTNNQLNQVSEVNTESTEQPQSTDSNNYEVKYNEMVNKCNNLEQEVNRLNTKIAKIEELIKEN